MNMIHMNRHGVCAHEGRTILFTNALRLGADIRDTAGETVYRIPSCTYSGDAHYRAMDHGGAVVVDRKGEDGNWQHAGTFENARIDPDCPHGCNWTLSTCRCD